MAGPAIPRHVGSPGCSVPDTSALRGDRLVFLDAETVIPLKAHKQIQDLERDLAGEACADNDLIFCQGDGRPWLPDHVSKRFRRLAAAAGVPVIKLHAAAGAPATR